MYYAMESTHQTKPNFKKKWNTRQLMTVVWLTESWIVPKCITTRDRVSEPPVSLSNTHIETQKKLPIVESIVFCWIGPSPTGSQWWLCWWWWWWGWGNRWGQIRRWGSVVWQTRVRVLITREEGLFYVAVKERRDIM